MAQYLFLMLTVILAQPVLAQDDDTKIAIMPFVNNTGDQSYDGICVGFSESITTILSSAGDFQFIERLQIDKAITEQDFQMSDQVDEKTVQELGKILGVEFVVVGSLQKLKGTFRVNARRMRVEDGILEEAVKITGTEEELFDLQDKIGEQLLQAFEQNKD